MVFGFLKRKKPIIFRSILDGSDLLGRYLRRHYARDRWMNSLKFEIGKRRVFESMVGKGDEFPIQVLD